ncbi:unnamed protein product [Phytophthora fragariaefolia]|uniref:Unnamed protein product n=1 Tax=Phytophthora fragariaefolia TaxID=1490495 RepID=A0A9W6YHS7_9STRA|nr:unnamed protein product [Phytophthora fragariaefolia]
MFPAADAAGVPMWLIPRWEFEYVETMKPQFGPADDVEVVEVGSDPDDDDDEVELMKVEPAVRKEAHLSTVQ